MTLSELVARSGCPSMLNLAWWGIFSMPHAMAMSFSVGSDFVLQVQRVCVEQTGNAMLRHPAARLQSAASSKVQQCHFSFFFWFLTLLPASQGLCWKCKVLCHLLLAAGGFPALGYKGRACFAGCSFEQCHHMVVHLGPLSLLGKSLGGYFYKKTRVMVQTCVSGAAYEKKERCGVSWAGWLVSTQHE